MSLPEVLLWRELRLRPGGFKFRRQHPELKFVCDFCCLQTRLLIEVDGAAHDMGDQPAYDSWRDAIMLDRGYRTLRIPAVLVLRDMEKAVNAIVAICRDVGPLHHPAPSASDGPPPRSGEDLA
jgi:very-short-patch-repair endonuclease